MSHQRIGQAILALILCPRCTPQTTHWPHSRSAASIHTPGSPWFRFLCQVTGNKESIRERSVTNAVRKLLHTATTPTTPHTGRPFSYSQLTRFRPSRRLYLLHLPTAVTRSNKDLSERDKMSSPSVLKQARSNMHKSENTYGCASALQIL